MLECEVVYADMLDCTHRIIVAGSRSWNDYGNFCVYMDQWLAEHADRLGNDFCFISGDARDGADSMIISYCGVNELPFHRMPADWDRHGRSAGMIRNHQMGDVATELVLFYDGRSRGSRDMLEYALSKKLKPYVYIVDPYWCENEQIRKTKRGAGLHPGQYRKVVTQHREPEDLSDDV